MADNQKWKLVEGRYYLNPQYRAPWYDIGLEGAIAGPPLAAAAAFAPHAAVALVGPRGLLFGSSHYRGRLNAGRFNHGRVRYGWSFNEETGMLELPSA